MYKLLRLFKPSTLLVVALSAFALQGCSKISIPESEPEPVAAPIAMVKPEIDYSSESPDCETAGQRLADNIEVGMTLGDVRRLVGKPVYRLPGSWWWSRGLSKTGKPNVQFDLVVSNDDVKVKKISTAVSGC